MRCHKGVVALQTARRGSEGVRLKNLMSIGGKPLYRYNLEGALGSRLIERVFVTTDIPEIAAGANVATYDVIERPPELADSTASHHDVIQHGVAEIERLLDREIEIAVVLLGNSVGGANSTELDAAIELLCSRPEADSVESVNSFPMFNPLRSLVVNEAGCLNTFLPAEKILEWTNLKKVNERGAAGKIMYFNGSFWVCRRRAIFNQDGPGNPPFPWQGRCVLPFEQDRVYMELDEPWQIEFLQALARNMKS